jgi:galactofuranosylgalactofuranosylrhamnosyl-N-acetylglucosaminyl-diphospho-decaprenol beta-1,5/1,6-galactofuranosyltransferase
MTQFLLQRSMLPVRDMAEPTLYVREKGGVTRGDESAALVAGAELSFDTSFGVFHAGRWRRLTSVGSVVARVVATGSGRVEVVSVHRGRERVVASAVLGAHSIDLAVGSLRDTQFGMLYVRIVATGACEVHRVEWRTDSPATHGVRLSLSITTFNRQAYVIPTVKKVLALVRSLPDLNGRVRVLVVDNANNVDFDEPPCDDLNVVPNRNLGGAGGFARGLMWLRQQRWATHVLFMDDDISLETEALVRTVALFAYARDPQLCIHGAMLSEERQWMQFEAGSKYLWRSLYPLRALGQEDDLRDRSLVLRDAKEKRFAYSAWWYTAFPIGITKDNPLPVFVRGDDVAFGLMHTGRHTVTLNGIAVWHADFHLKNNPSSLFYEMRNFATIDTLVFDRHRWWHLGQRFLALSFRNLFGFRYASAEYMIRGMRAYLAGPQALAEVDHTALHDELRRVTEEKPAPLSPEHAAVTMSTPLPKPVRLIGFVLSLPLVGGFLLPRSVRSRELRTAPIDSRAVGLALRHEQILYRHDRLPEGFVCARDGARFRALWRDVFGVLAELARNYGRLKREYRTAYPALVSDEAWQRRFDGVSAVPKR